MQIRSSDGPRDGLSPRPDSQVWQLDVASGEQEKRDGGESTGMVMAKRRDDKVRQCSVIASDCRPCFSSNPFPNARNPNNGDPAHARSMDDIQAQTYVSLPVVPTLTIPSSHPLLIVSHDARPHAHRSPPSHRIVESTAMRLTL